MWDFDISQPYRPPTPVTGIALLFYFKNLLKQMKHKKLINLNILVN
jgi:hypothetical protein